VPPTSSPTLVARYDALVAVKAIERDDAQFGALKALDRLLVELQQPPRRGGILGFFGRPVTPRGVYLFGGIGRGKTTLMDLFYDAASENAKRRVHFHGFMWEVHARLHSARKRMDADPVTRVAHDLAQETRLLCFDEFAVSDIADATILARFFKALFSKGVVVVATSNIEPRRLYEGGRNRDLFLPFIDLLEHRMEVVRVDARADFRQEKSDCGEVFFIAADADAKARVGALMGQGPYAPASVKVQRRLIEIPRAQGSTARFDFSEICGRPLGAADFMALAKAYDVIVVENLPRLDFERRNEAKRFVTLVDVLYETKTKLILSAEGELETLYPTDRGLESLEFNRAVSRLVEMRSKDYLDAWAARRRG
jgi:cell division protein ZapE